jgi:hypothetical protein
LLDGMKTYRKRGLTAWYNMPTGPKQTGKWEDRVTEWEHDMYRTWIKREQEFGPSQQYDLPEYTRFTEFLYKYRDDVAPRKPKLGKKGRKSSTGTKPKSSKSGRKKSTGSKSKGYSASSDPSQESYSANSNSKSTSDEKTYYLKLSSPEGRKPRSSLPPMVKEQIYPTDPVAKSKPKKAKKLKLRVKVKRPKSNRTSSKSE